MMIQAGRKIRLKKWQYRIRAEWGVHAREAVKLVREVKKYKSRIFVKGNGKCAEASDVMELMELDLKCGQTAELILEGEDEEAALAGMKEYWEGNL